MKELLDKWFHHVVQIKIGGIILRVVVLDVKQMWGKVRWLVTPEAGKGEIWIENFLELN